LIEPLEEVLSYVDWAPQLRGSDVCRHVSVNPGNPAEFARRILVNWGK
jgi:hypothetical protein